MSAFAELMEFTRQTQALAQVSERLGWDRETTMPPGAAAQRAEESAALAEAWSLFDNDQKERALVFATRVLDNSYIWRGVRTSKLQGLAWPREHVRDEEGDCLPKDVIPKNLRAAVVFLALYGKGTSPLGLDASRRVASVQADSLKVEFRQDGAGQPSVVPEFVRSFLSGLGTPKDSTRTARIIRT